MLSIDQVAFRYDVDRATIWRWRKAGKFPKPIRAEEGLRWDEGFLDAWDKAIQQAPELLKLDYADWKEMESKTTVKWTPTCREAMKKENPDAESTLRELKLRLALSAAATNGELVGTVIDLTSEIQRLKIIVRKIKNLVK